MALKRFTPRYEFAWDLDQALANERKHGVPLQWASEVFNDPLAEFFHNVSHEAVEDRWSILGMTPTGVLLVVLHTYVEARGNKRVRIISARKATQYERREYQTGRSSIPEYDEPYEKSEAEFDLDLSQGIRGAFTNCHFPIFIDNAVLGHFHTRARTTGVDMTEAINDALRRHIGLPSEMPEPAERG